MRHVAWLPQKVPTSRQLTAREYVAYVAWLKGEDRTGAWERAGKALDQVGLAEQSGRKTAKLSGGQLRRVGIACALAHDAQVILLDEPTAGLDPHQRTVFRNVLRTVADRIPVLMSTHDIADLADEANTVSLMDRGRVLHHGATRSFLDQARSDAAPGRAGRVRVRRPHGSGEHRITTRTPPGPRIAFRTCTPRLLTTGTTPTARAGTNACRSTWRATTTSWTRSWRARTCCAPSNWPRSATSPARACCTSSAISAWTPSPGHGAAPHRSWVSTSPSPPSRPPGAWPGHWNWARTGRRSSRPTCTTHRPPSPTPRTTSSTRASAR